jgi:Leucine-rich repeat (LRR) protein
MIFSEVNAYVTIKLNGNQLERPLPQSLANCTKLEVFDLGDNNIEDTFPSWLETLQELQVSSNIIKVSSETHAFNIQVFKISKSATGDPFSVEI